MLHILIDDIKKLNESEIKLDHYPPIDVIVSNTDGDINHYTHQNFPTLNKNIKTYINSNG